MNGKLGIFIGIAGIVLLGAFGFMGRIPWRDPAQPAATPVSLVTPSAFSVTLRPVRFAFGGDVMLGRAVGVEARKRSDFSYPFQDIASAINGADVAMANLESPLVDGCPVSGTESMKLCAVPAFAPALWHAGFTALSFANNHMLDYGARGVHNTNALLSGAGIAVVNNASSTVVLVQGRRIGFTAFNLTWGNVKDEDVRFMISDLRKRADFIVVNFHWGDEYTDAPNAYQQRIAHLAVDAGADVVVGHHPHHVQQVEQYKGKYIFYSLGNLVFDQTWSEATRLGALVRLAWQPDTGALTYDVVAVRTDDQGVARVLEGTEAQQLVASMERSF